MNITVNRNGDAQVFSLKGRLDSDSAPEFERRYHAETNSETMALILDLTALEYVSSVGLRSILSAGKLMKARGGQLVLCVPRGLTRDIIEGSGFHQMFTIVSTPQETGKLSPGTFRVLMHKEWDVDVMTIFGRVDSERAPEVEAAGRNVLSAPFQKLLINMSAVEYLSSAGLCALLTLRKLADAKHGRLFLCSPAAQVMEVLKMSGFDKIFTVRDSVQAALVE
jgi:anti-anti-sigma factor